MVYINIAEGEGQDCEEPVEFPLDADGALSHTTLTSLFPGTTGIKFRSSEGKIRAVSLAADGKFYPPEDGWGDRVYYCIGPKENKRKSDDSDSLNQIHEIVKSLKDINLAETIENLKLLKETKYNLDLLNVEKGYSYVGEAACAILDAYSGKRKIGSLNENKSPNKKRPSLTRKTPTSCLNKPQFSELITAKDFKYQRKCPPLQQEFDQYLENSKDVRHGLDHDAQHSPVHFLKEVYDKMEQSMENLRADEEKICQRFEDKSKRLAPLSKCPDFNTVIMMKPYF